MIEINFEKKLCLNVFIVLLLVNKTYQKINSNFQSSKINTTNSPNKCDSNAEFECLNSEKCINLMQLCDKRFDCSDRSDEFNCHCKNFVEKYSKKLSLSKIFRV